MQILKNEMSEPILNLNKFIIPLMISNNVDVNQLVDSLLQKNYVIKSNICSNDNELFPNVKNLISENFAYENNIASSVLINKQAFQCELDLPDKTISLKLGNIYLVVFKSGIAFLVYDAFYQNEADIHDIIECNYYLKAIQHNKLKIVKQNVKDFDNQYLSAQSDHTIACKSYIKGIKDFKIDISNLSTDRAVKNCKLVQKDQAPLLIYDTYEDYSYFFKTIFEEIPITGFLSDTDEYTQKIPEKALLFNSLLVDHVDLKAEGSLTSLYRLSKGYNSSYIPPTQELSTDTLNVMDYSVWRVSREGVGNLVSITNDNKTDNFLRADYHSRVKNYLHLYLVSLHAYYGLIMYSNTIANLPIEIENYANNNSQLLCLNEVRATISSFSLKCIMDQVSQISHQQAFFDQLNETLAIKNLLLSLDFKLNRVFELVTAIEESKKLRNEEHRNKRMKGLKIFGIIFALVAFYSTILQSLPQLIETFPFLDGNHLLVSLLIVLGFLLLGGIIYLVWDFVIVTLKRLEGRK